MNCPWGADDISIILSTLRDENIKATFFLVGHWAQKFPDSVKAMAADGHDVANHSNSHLRLGALDKDRIKTEITACTETLETLTGAKTDLFRAPYGDYTNNVIQIAKDMGYYTIQWDVDGIYTKVKTQQSLR